MIPQSLASSSGGELPLPAYKEGEVTHVATVPRDSASETSGRAVRVAKLDNANANYRHYNLLFKTNQINNPKIILLEMNNAQVLFLHNSSANMGLITREGRSLSQPVS